MAPLLEEKLKSCTVEPYLDYRKDVRPVSNMEPNPLRINSRQPRMQPSSDLLPTIKEALAATVSLTMESLVEDCLVSLIESQAPLEERVNNMVEYLVEYCSVDRPTENDIAGAFVDIWDAILELALRLPAGHPSQLDLLLTVNIMYEREGPVTAEHPNFRWSNLPGLVYHLEEFWSRKVSVRDGGQGYLHQRWMNLNSFVARLSSAGFDQGLYLGIQLICDVLEVGGDRPLDVIDCQLWVAAEWLAYLAPRLRWEMRQEPEGWEDFYWPRGPLLLENNIAARSPARWVYWKTSLLEASCGTRRLRLSPGTLRRMRKAHRIMVNLETIRE